MCYFLNTVKRTRSFRSTIKQAVQRIPISCYVLALFAILTAVAARNVLANLNTLAVGWDFDVYINPWADWWTVQAWRDPEVSLWYSDMIFYPQGAGMAYHSFSHYHTALSLALRPFLGTLPAYNLVVLSNYALTGLAMFHLGRYLTGSSMAGLIAGVVLAFNSHNLYQSSHPVLLGIWCIPWATMFLMRAVREDSPKYAAVTALFVFSAALVGTIMFIVTTMWVALLLAYFYLATTWPRPSLRVLAVLGGLSALLVLPVEMPLLMNVLGNRDTSFVRNYQEAITLDILSPFLPHWFLWRSWTFYFGIIPLSFLMVARRHGRETWLWYGVLIGLYIFAIGPRPSLLFQEIDVTLPWSIPITTFLRNPYRLSILMSLALAVLAAYGWLALSKHIRPERGRVIAAVMALLIYGEYTAPAFPWVVVQVSPFYTEFLADVPDDVALATLPTGQTAGKVHLYYQTLHGHPITNGHVSRESDEVFTFIRGNAILRAGMDDWPAVPLPADVDTPLRALAEVGVGYLVIDKKLMKEDMVQQWRALLQREAVYEDEWVVVYGTGGRKN